MVTWPKEFGGRACDLIEWLIFEEEYYRAGAPLRVNQNGIFLLGPTLMEYGTEAQKERFISAMARGDEIWAQAMARRARTARVAVPPSIQLPPEPMVVTRGSASRHGHGRR